MTGFNKKGAHATLALRNAALRVHVQTPRATRAAARVLERRMKIKVSVPGHGVPSRPGQPPRVQSGELLGSIHIERQGLRAWDVIVDAEHGVHLELGTIHMDPRPFARPAMNESRVEMAMAAGAQLRFTRGFVDED